MRGVVSLAVGMLFVAQPASADLYRWVDPETGSVKFSSYPPPWFNDAQKAGRAPKVEVIPPARSAPAFAPELERGAAPADAPAAALPRGELLKQITQRVAALASAAPDAVERPAAELAESLKALEQLDARSKVANPKDEAARQEEKWQLAAPLEARRVALMQQVAGLPPPQQGTARDAISIAWRTTYQLMAAMEKINDALNTLDPRKLNARHFEMRALTEKVAAAWEPFGEIVAGRGAGAR